jgi:hypothetical protein
LGVDFTRGRCPQNREADFLHQCTPDRIMVDLPAKGAVVVVRPPVADTLVAKNVPTFCEPTRHPEAVETNRAPS